ncbi:ferrochelatase hem15 [Extremus antarcticus]|uniref:Ferrochelatase hem15 n=1 Tax=Extremus antarcticus TaxID=702011 RepID=A0AAJ0LWW8_9PEZI|nr:ferrochelatase hem15 [Extremus antarcticus]
MPSLRRVLRKIRSKHGHRSPPSPRQDEDQKPHSASFLGLPAELRNQVYHELAAQTALTLTPFRLKKAPVLNGLLLACHQTRAEFKKVLFANAHVTINIHEYKFSNLIRVLETLSEEHLSMLKLNRDIWIIFYLAHVPTRDDRRNLRGWIDYRGSRFCVPYFGSAQAQQAARELFFEYDVRYLDRLRPPRPPIRYLTRHDMKLDLLRSHLRMYKHLEREDEEDAPSEELVRLRRNVEECVQLLEDLQLERSTPRNMSVVTTCTLPNS